MNATGPGPRRTALLLGFALLLNAWGCSPYEPLPFDPADYVMEGYGIVGGTNTSGWPPVGVHFGTGGSMCTATLVDPEVVLTAAHCLAYSGSQDLFCVGSNVDQMTWNDCHQVAQWVAHPSYNGDSHDVAVLVLQSPIYDIEPIPAHTGTMNNSWTGRWVHYVGFGSNTYYQGPGSGIKRETDIQIYEVHSYDYYHYTPGTNVCSGDSGGPALYEVGGEWNVIGINSAVFSNGGDACAGGGVVMRVDAELDFFDNYYDPYSSSSDDDGSDDDVSDDDGSDDDVSDDDVSDDDTVNFADLPEPRTGRSYDEPEGCACSSAADRPSLAGLLALLPLLVARRLRRVA